MKSLWGYLLEELQHEAESRYTAVYVPVAEDLREALDCELARAELYRYPIKNTPNGEGVVNGSLLSALADAGRSVSWAASHPCPLWAFPIASRTSRPFAFDSGVVFYSPRYQDDRYVYRHVILSSGVRAAAERLAAKSGSEFFHNACACSFQLVKKRKENATDRR